MNKCGKKGAGKMRGPLLIILLCLLVCSGNCPAENKYPNILILNSYHKGYEFSDNETDGVLGVLEKYYPGIEPRIEYLDCKNYSEMSHFESEKNLFLKKYSGMKFAVIISLDDPAFLFIKKYKDELFPGTPVIFGGVNNFKEEMLNGCRGITGVSEGMDIGDNISEMMKLFPATKEIIFIHDYTITGKATHDEAEEQFDKIQNLNVKLTFLPDLTMQELSDTVSKLDKHTLVLLLTFTRDRDGVFFNVNEFTSILAKASKVPIFGTREEMLGYGILGGKIISGNSHARFAGEMAVRLFHGKPVDSIAVFKGSTSVFMFDYNVMNRFDISAGQLPGGSVIINKPAGFYQKYSAYIWIITGVFIFMVAIIVIMSINILRRRKAENNLIELEQRMQLALKLTASSAFENNFKTGQTIVSPAVFINMGYLRGEIPTSINDQNKFIHPEDMINLKQAIEKHTSGKSENYYVEYRLKSKDDKWIWHSSSGKVIEVDKEGNPVRLIGLIQDISDRREAQEKLIEYAEELKATNASKDKFFSIIAHDLKSPFLGLLGFSNVLSKNLDELTKDDIKKYAGYINKATRSIYDLIEQLLAWSRLQTGRIEFKPVKIDFREICEGTANVLINNARSKSIELINDIMPGTIITADENMIRSILHNLVSNAIKFSNPGGIVRISAKFKDKFLVVKVSDNGVGIKNTDMHKLFKLDEQLSNRGTSGEEGTGLGLVLCREMVAKHKGEIFAESELGKGSSFTFTIPL